MKNKITQKKANNNINKQIKTINKLKLCPLNFNTITISIINNLKDRYDYYKIDDKYIYFKDYVIGKGCYGLVVFWIKLDNNTPLQ